MNKISHSLFILSLAILILNDWFLKTTFHNDFTGKLSDFAGLFAFPFFFGLVFFNNKRLVHLLSGILFLFWNSEFSQPFINYLNSCGIPVIRTVDITDNIALISIFASYQCHKYQLKHRLKPIFQSTLMVISCLAFMATTLSPREDRKFINIEKEYRFEFSKRELVSRLNMVQLKEIHSLNKLSGEIDFDDETNVFHYHGRTDTLAIILDYDKITEQDTIEFKSSFAEISITGDESISKLKLLTIYKAVPVFKEKDYREKAIKQFERRIVKKVKKYR